MTKKIKLTSKKRTEKNSNELRKGGQVPAIMYGPDVENTNLQVDSVQLDKAYEEAGESSLIDLKIDDAEPMKVIIKDVQIDAIKDKITHVDFFQVDMKEPLEVEVPFEFIGEAKAEKDHGAVILKNLESVLVKSLPSDLLDSIEIDLSKLENIGDSIRVSDLNLSDKFEILTDEHTSIVSAIEQTVEEEPAPSEEGEEATEAGAEEKKTDEASAESESKE